MPDIHIEREHSLGMAKARELAFKWVEQAEQRLDMPVGVLEFTLQTLNTSFADEFRSLPQQVQTRAISNLQGAIGTGCGGHSAEHEFRIQPVAALLEIATIGHLRDQIRGAQQMS